MLRSWSAASRCAIVAASCLLAMSGHASGATLAAKAKAEGCTGKPSVVQGTNLYKCTTKGGMHYFNLEGAVNEAAPNARGGSAAPPQGFPKVDTATQKGRDAVRRKVLADELAVEEKLLAEAKGEYGNGAPPATQEEKDVPKKYADRLAKLRQTIALHEKNIEALKKELAATR
jgi:hypothetical protein